MNESRVPYDLNICSVKIPDYKFTGVEKEMNMLQISRSLLIKCLEIKYCRSNVSGDQMSEKYGDQLSLRSKRQSR